MAKILVVGCGDLGSEVIRLLANAGHDLFGVRRSAKALPNKRAAIQADVTNLSSLSSLEMLFPNVVIYCVSANAQTDDSYKAQYVDGLSNVLLTQKQNKALQHVFFVSSTRVYGQATDIVLNESIPAMPNDFGGKRLLEAESLLKALPCGGTAIRLAGIYGPGRLYLVNMAKDLSRWPKTNKWTNRIHRDDAAGFITFLCQKVLAGDEVSDCYIGADDQPSKQYEVLSWLAQQMDVPVPNGIDALPSGGKRLSNQRLHDVGFQLTYPNYQQGYQEVLKDV